MPEFWNRIVSPYHFGKLYLAVCVMFSFLQKGYTFHCVQCNSLQKEGCRSGVVKPTICLDNRAKYCRKDIGQEKSGPGHFVFRSCTQKFVNNCTHQKHEDAMYQVCHHTCSTEGCNRAPRVGLHTGVWVALLCMSAKQLLSSALHWNIYDVIIH